MLKFCHTVPSLRGALLGYTSNRLMLTNLACPWGYTTVQRLHHRQTRSLGTKGWKDASECNNWMIAQCATFYKKIWILEWREKRFGYPFPYPVPIWKQFLDIPIRLQTHYPAVYPTGKQNSDRTSTHCKPENKQRKSYRILISSCWPADIWLFDFHRKRELGPDQSHYNQSRLWYRLH